MVRSDAPTAASDSVELQSLTNNNISSRIAPEPGDHDREIASFRGFTAPLWKSLLYYFLVIITGGVIFLVSQWFLRVRVLLTLKASPIADANWVLITRTDKQQELIPVKQLHALDSINSQNGIVSGGTEAVAQGGPTTGDRILEYRCERYLFQPALGAFLLVPSVPEGFAHELDAASAARRIKGQLLDEWERAHRQLLYGPNQLCIPVKSIFTLLGEEMIHPFYVFQYASVLIWCLEAYYSYSSIILGITMFSVLTTVGQAHRYRRRLAALAHFTCEVQVVQPGGSLVVMDSKDLVPGDIVVVHPGLLPCDIVMLRGEAIVDENMLTGEAVPVRKVPYSPYSVAAGQYDADVHKGCTLYCGTTVAQVRPGGPERMALGVVARTAFWTAKGQLLKSILYPRQHKQTFSSDSVVFIAFMLCLGIAFYVWDIVALASYGAPAWFIILRYFDLITVAVPPALPACLTVATAIAVARLAEHGVFVSNPSAITAAGHLDVICFDKTGTLTETGLDLLGILPVDGQLTEDSTVNGTPHTREPDSLTSKYAFGHLIPGGLSLPFQFQEVLATCHGLAQLNGGLVGDPLDQKLFEATGWRMLDDGAGAPIEIVAFPEETLTEDGEQVGGSPTSLAGTPRHRVPGSPGVLKMAHVRTSVSPPPLSGGASAALTGIYVILRRFEFSSEKQRNLVVVEHPGASLHVHVKGSPEMIKRLVDPTSVPSDFDAVLGRHTRQGLRMLALATRRLTGMRESDVLSLSQDALETDLRFLGFAVMANPLRDDTPVVLAELHGAGIRTVMVTGDHVRTAVSVAHQAGMLVDGLPVACLDVATSGEGRIQDTAIKISYMAAQDTPGQQQTDDDGPALLQALAMHKVDAAVTGRGFQRLVLDSSAAPTLGAVVATVGGGGLDTVLHRATVFARMAPGDKSLLVELLGEGTTSLGESGQESPGLGHFVGFCGDGANDVGALKAAHVGVSLCEAEASVAAPLTSNAQTIACMVHVVSEGRCSLDASYLIFKFIIVYAFVQVFAVSLMYSFGGSVGNYQYLIQDLLYTTALAGTMGFTRPSKRLSPHRPPDRLMSTGIWLPVLGQFVCCATFQLVALALLSRQPWYERFDPGSGDPTKKVDCFGRTTANSPECSKSWENSAVFIMSLGQFLITAVIFNKGPPHRRVLWTNPWLMIVLSLQTAFLVFLTFTGGDPVSEAFAGLVPFPDVLFRWKMFGLLAANFAVAWMVEQGSLSAWQVLRGRRVCGMTII